MIIERKSTLSGQVNQMDIPVTQAQLDSRRAGELIQKAMPHLTPDQREFIMTGITPDEWDAMFGRQGN